MRLDRFLVTKGIGSRKEVQKIIKAKQILVNSTIVLDPKYKVNVDDTITYNDIDFIFKEFVYFVLNKPNGYVSATEDNYHSTVLDLLSDEDFQTDIFPVGRLDIDTTGFLLLTNDGEFAHQMLSPKKHVSKTYEAIIDHKLSSKDVNLLESGVFILDDYFTKPAKVKVIEDNKIHLTISEGKYHQVKEMLKAVDNEVLNLKRITFGNVSLADDLELGNYIEVTKEYFD